MSALHWPWTLAAIWLAAFSLVCFVSWLDKRDGRAELDGDEKGGL